MKNTRSYPLSDKSYFGLDLQVAFFVFRVPPSCFAAATLGCGLSCLWRLFCSNGTPVSLISAGRCSSRSSPSSRSSSSSSSPACLSGTFSGWYLVQCDAQFAYDQSRLQPLHHTYSLPSLVVMAPRRSWRLWALGCFF